MGDDDGCGSGPHAFEGWFVEVIEMGVGDENEIHADEGFRRDRRRGESGDSDGFGFDAHPDAFGEDRVDGDCNIVNLGND